MKTNSPMKTKWRKDDFAEQILAKLELPSKIMEVPMQDIDWVTSEHNNARLESPVDTDHVSDIAAGIKNGDVIPMPVLLKQGAKCVIMAGNHRIPAAREVGDTSVLAHVVETADQILIKIMPSLLNAPVRAVSREDRIRLACQAAKVGVDCAKAAGLFGLTYSKLRGEISSEARRTELEKAGIKGMPKTLTHLSLGITNTNVLHPLCRLAIRAKLSVPEFSAILRDVKAASTESQKIGVIGEREKQMGVDRPLSKLTAGKKNRAVSTTLQINISTLENLLNARTITEFGFSDLTQRAAVIIRLKKLAKSISEICKRSEA